MVTCLVVMAICTDATCIPKFICQLYPRSFEHRDRTFVAGVISGMSAQPLVQRFLWIGDIAGSNIKRPILLCAGSQRPVY